MMRDREILSDDSTLASATAAAVTGRDRAQIPAWLWVSLATLGTGAIAFVLWPISTCACGDPAAIFVGTVARIQQYHHAETGQFASAIADFPTDLQMDAIPHYTHTVQASTKQVWIHIIPEPNYFLSLQLNRKQRFAYVSGVFWHGDTNYSAIVCQADRSGYVQLEPPQLINQQPACAPGSHQWQ